VRRFTALSLRSLLAVLLLVGLFGTAQAHAALDSSEPADGSVLAAAPAAITLNFTEELEVGFSTIKLYRLANDLELNDTNYAAKLNSLAALLVNEVIESRAQDERAVAVQLAPSAGRTRTVQLMPDAALEPGAYVVMWRILSVDTHVVQAFSTFTVTE
jgi:methionine-rich copper-binding protein CopC